MNNVKYVAILNDTIKTLGLNVAAEQLNHLRLAAAEIDQLRGEVADLAFGLSKRLAAYAADIDGGRTSVELPTASMKGANDLLFMQKKNDVLLRKAEGFPLLLTGALGFEAEKKFFELIRG